MEFSTIGAPGNPALDIPTQPGIGGPAYNAVGRGSVPHTFALSRTEITTHEWLQFVNNFSARGDLAPNGRPDQLGMLGFVYGLFSWGAAADPTYTGPGFRYVSYSRQASNLAVGDIGWRTAAMYCNWLHNGRGSDLASLLSGAYDTSTWGYSSVTGYTDALTRQPGAKYWIPDADEWIKAAFFDPNRFGPDAGGWWTSMNRSDTLPMPGTPGTPGATTNVGLQYPVDGYNFPGQIPAGSYPDAQSPWGLLDTSGGVAEWVEEPFYSSPGVLRERGHMGSADGDPLVFLRLNSTVWSVSSNPPGYLGSPRNGFRIATVPSPGSFVVVAIAWLINYRRRSPHAS